jgi:tRNA(fMet)-specific endonuclease VapC
MTRFLLDTGSAGDYIYRRRGVYDRVRDAARQGHRIGIGVPVLAELWYGVENSVSRDRNADRVRRALPDLLTWPVTERAAEIYGQIAATLRRAGRPIGTNDMLIAAIALSLGKTTVVSADADLRAVPNLIVEDWSSS